MNKRLQYMTLIISGLGYLIFSLSSIFRHSLTEFTLGFFEGVSLVFIATWAIYMCYCIVKKKSPYKIN